MMVMKMKMKMKMKVVMMLFLVMAAQFPFLMAFQHTVPAFLWSPHSHQYSDNGMEQAVNYQTISSNDLAKSILSEGGWSNLLVENFPLCSEKKFQQPLDLALVFVGRELLSSDISANKNVDPALVNLLKVSFLRSNFSMAFPYVATEEEKTIENSLVSGFAETCAQDLGISNVAFSDSCSVEGENIQKLKDLHAVQEYLTSRMEKRPRQAELVVFCHGGSDSMEGINKPKSESEVFSELISSVETLGAKYSILYVSDPYRSIHYPSYRSLERFLAEGNGSLNSTICDEVCKIKSSLLEGVLVGVVLLIILISGLCCMMGIDTPTRFEAPQES